MEALCPFRFWWANSLEPHFYLKKGSNENI